MANRLDEIEIVKKWSVKEFYHNCGDDATACTRTYQGEKKEGIMFGTCFVAISKSCEGASAKQIFKNHNDYEVLKIHDNANDTDFWRVSKRGSDYYQKGESLSL